MATASIQQPPTGYLKKFSSWRYYMPIEANTDEEQQVASLLQTQISDIPDKSKHVTALASSDTTSHLVFGTASRTDNLAIVHADSLQVVGRYTIEQPVYTVDWSNNHILCGTAENIVRLYQVRNIDSSPQISQAAPSFAHIPLKGGNNPGMYIHQDRIHAAKFQPSDNSSFLSAHGPYLRIWNTNSSAPVISCKAANDTIFDATWSPHLPSVIAIGGSDKAMTIVDTRLMGFKADIVPEKYEMQSPIVWFKHKAHSQGPIRTVKWSPFVPFWIATGGEDRVVNIWDVRYGSNPVLKIEHNHSVYDICWSTSHADLISTACADQSWRLWNLKTDSLSKVSRSHVSAHSVSGAEHFNAMQVAECGRQFFSTHVVAIAANPSSNDSFITVSSSGELANNQLGPDLYDGLLHYNGIYDELSSCIFRRDLEGAYSFITKWAKSPQNESKIDEINQMLKRCVPLQDVFDSEWKFHPQDVDNISFASFLGQNGNYEKKSAAKLDGKLSPAAGAAAKAILTSLFNNANDPFDIISSIYQTAELKEQKKRDFSYFSPVEEEAEVQGQFFSSDKQHNAALLEFQTLLKTLKWALPPMFNVERLKTKFPSQLHIDMDNLNLKMMLLATMKRLKMKRQSVVEKVLENDTSQSNDGELFNLQRDILQTMENDPSCLSPALIQKYVELAFSFDFIRGWEVAKKIVDILHKMESHEDGIKFHKMQPLFHRLLYPTFYDQDTSISNYQESQNKKNNQLQKILCSPNVVVPMIKLEFRMHKLLQRLSGTKGAIMTDHIDLITLPIPSIAEEIIQEMASQKSISIFTNKSYLSALLLASRFGDYFSVLFNLLATYSFSDLNHSFMSNAEKAAFPRFKKCIDSSLKLIEASQGSSFSISITPKSTKTGFADIYESASPYQTITMVCHLYLVLTKTPAVIFKDAKTNQFFQAVATMVENAFGQLTKKFVAFMKQQYETLSVNKVLVQKQWGPASVEELVSDIKRIHSTVNDMMVNDIMAMNQAGGQGDNDKNKWSIKNASKDMNMFLTRLKEIITSHQEKVASTSTSPVV